ncbi:MAG TPA: MATE family efflux transporter [Firmicutes bacterium]|nr:MATE family efflux transporter [Bacillota bacterium]
MAKFNVGLGEHLTSKKIFLAVIAPICMMIFTSFYSAIDGIFLANVVGGNAFSGVNLIWPYCMALGGLGFMLGTGGAALVSKTLGENDKEKANRYFSLIVYFAFALGVVASIVGYFTVEPFVKWMASLSTSDASEAVDYAIRYGRILMLGVPMFMLQNVFQSFFATSEKPLVGFAFIAGAGISNICLDALFVGVMGLEVEGAGIATLIGYFIAGILPIFYFIFKKGLNINLGKTKLEWKPLLKASFNGSSEFVSNIASSIVSMCYNAQLLIYAGPKGVSAYGVIMYISFAFMAIFIGYSMGIAPFVGFNFGANRNDELHNIFKRSMIIIAITSVAMFALSELVGPYFCQGFARNDKELLSLSIESIRIYSFVYLTCGFSIFGSSFFTALNNGLVSAIISIVRTLLFEIVCILTLPLLLGVYGIWAAGPIAEIGSSILTLYFFIKEKKRYYY